MNTSKPAGQENPPQKKSHQQVKPKDNERAHKNGRKHPDQETRGSTPLRPTDPLSQKFTPKAGKAEHLESQNKQKESPRMGRQRKNLSSKGLGHSLVRVK